MNSLTAYILFLIGAAVILEGIAVYHLIKMVQVLTNELLHDRRIINSTLDELYRLKNQVKRGTDGEK